MSRIAPDIPELQHVPEAVRSLVYIRALNSAIRSPLTWFTGGVLLIVVAGIGATQGRALFGIGGAIIGTVLGAFAAGWIFFKVILPWRARRELPRAIDSTSGDTLLDDVGRADERLRRMAARATDKEQSS